MKRFLFFGIHADISILCMFFFHVRQAGRGIRKFDQRTRFCIQQRWLWQNSWRTDGKLYKISQDYPDWEEIIQKEGEDSENVKKVTTAYKTWNNTLESATTDNHYMFMTYCNIPNAIEQITGKGASKKTEETKESEDTSNDLSSSSSDTNIDEMLDSYEEYVNELSDFYAKLKDMEPGSEEYMSTLGEAQELEGSYQDLLENARMPKATLPVSNCNAMSRLPKSWPRQWNNIRL